MFLADKNVYNFFIHSIINAWIVHFNKKKKKYKLVNTYIRVYFFIITYKYTVFIHLVFCWVVTVLYAHFYCTLFFCSGLKLKKISYFPFYVSAKPRWVGSNRNFCKHTLMKRTHSFCQTIHNQINIFE